MFLPAAAALAESPYTNEGVFGRALDARMLDGRALETKDIPQYGARPLTVEAWVRSDSSSQYNVFVAYASKSSVQHWEFYSKPRTGFFGAYLPGKLPTSVDTRVSITDGEWHFVAMLLEEERVRLYVDGEEAAKVDLVGGGPAADDEPGNLFIGGYTPDDLTCQGLIDDLRITSGLRSDVNPPDEPLQADEKTIGLWSFDTYGFKDASQLQASAALSVKRAAPPLPEKQEEEEQAQKGIGNRDYSGISFAEADGRFGRAFDPQLRSRYGATVRENPLYQDMPFTVECWVKLRADDGKSSAILTGGYYQNPFGVMTNHWRLTSDPRTGYLHAYFQGNNPSHVSTETDVADGEWHYVAMIAEANRVRLYVDGQLAGEEAVSQPITINRGSRRISEGPLMIGHNRPHKWLCHGLLDEVRMSTGTRDVSTVPDAPFEADERTTGLWRFDELDEKDRFADASGALNWARVLPSGDTLDENDRIQFGVEADPFDRPMSSMNWQPAQDMASAEPLERSRWEGAEELMLNGAWDCVEAPVSGRSPVTMQREESWEDAFTANVPCTIQTALYEAGRLPDPMVLRNDEKYQWTAHREWWLRRTFEVPDDWRGKSVKLVFDGVDYRANFWLNGSRLGAHEGMWGGPAFDVAPYLKFGEENELLVALDPAPWNYQDTLKNNVAYGWHYVKMVTLGIWRPVRLQARGDAEMESPFLTTTAVDGTSARTALSIDIRSEATDAQDFTLACSLIPKNHDGPGYRAEAQVQLEPGMNRLGFEGVLRDARLWWPVDLGDPNLYRFECELSRDGEVVDFYRTNWGARTIEVAPSGAGPDPETYNWLMLVNGERTWLKGANWCLPDALLRLDRKRLERHLELARHSHVQMLRVWGGGPIENDVLYDLCDEMGIMIQQEFSMLGYHRLQNVPSMNAIDLTHHMVPRLRNRPSLAMWVGANEITGQGRIVEVLGRRILELDGTRAFRRSCPTGGDLHYHIYWSQRPLPLHQELGQRPIAFTEFGMSSFANLETWKRIVPEDEWSEWPPARDAVMIHHTPTFIYRHVGLTERFAREFVVPDDLPSVIEGIQLAQCAADKFLIERMRSRKPVTAMTHVYKLTENYPGASWSLIDYYGVPKRALYNLRNVHRPVHVMALFDDWSSAEGQLPVEISAVNDGNEPVSGVLTATLYDGKLQQVEQKEYEIEIPTDRALDVDAPVFDVPASVPRPLVLLLEFNDGQQEMRNYYTFDFAEDSGCLFEMPRTQLSAKLAGSGEDRRLVVRNTGDKPAVCVDFDLGRASDTFYFDDMLLWLKPGESREIAVHETLPIEGPAQKLGDIAVKAWNAESVVAKP
jgi:beta-mannosidase